MAAPGVLEAGIDTVKLLYRVRDEREQDMAREHFARPRDLGPLKAGYIAPYELLWVEGRAVKVTDPESHALLPAGALPDVQEAVLRLVQDELPSVAEVGVSRLDPTVTVNFGRPADGWAAMRGVLALDFPRREPTCWWHLGRPATIGLRFPGSRTLQERVYDRGLKARTAPQGMVVRFEGQGRFQARERTTAGWWTMERVREGFERRFGPMARAADGVHVASEAGIREQIRELVERKAVTARQAELLLGHIGAESVGIRRPATTVKRRRRELRRLGLAHALDGHDGLGGQDVDVDLGAVLDELLTTERWRG